MSQRLSLVIVVSLTAGLCGCATESDPGEVVGLPPAEAAPVVEPTERTEPTEPTAAAPGCQYSEGIEPTAPGIPQDFCRVDRISDEGTLLQHSLRDVTIDDDDGLVTTTTTTDFDQDGAPVRRRVVTTDDTLIAYESLEHLQMDPMETLPDTYGVPATWSRTRTFDAAGNELTEAYDIGMDGTLETQETWKWSLEGVMVEYRRIGPMGLAWREDYRPDGQPILKLDSGDYGHRWYYDADGLLIRQDRVVGGTVLERTIWVTFAPGMPLEQTTTRLKVSNDGTVVGEEPIAHHTWTRDENGALLSDEGTAIILGYERAYFTEYDAEGREVVYIEETESIDCHMYYRTTTRNAAGEVIDRLTTCDGALFEHLTVTVDAFDRPVHSKRIFIGNPTWTILDESFFAYDECGAVTMKKHTWNSTLSRLETLEHDAQGRVISRYVEQKNGEPRSFQYAYDAEGRVVQMGELTWTWRPDGRLDDAYLGATLGATDRFSYACTD